MLAEAEKWRAELVEKIAETDDSLMTAYLEGKVFDIDTIKKGLRKAVLDKQNFSCYDRFGSEK